ncbi:MAG: hypothetical protein JSU58_10340 [Dehalococcoidales bacterium]|nr:MAG: hypothetical protein JSU58_10340 [Dehalococcoidales bacterium]
METALVSMVCVALIIISSVTMMVSSFTSVSTIVESWQQMEEEADNIRRTDISSIPPENYTGGIIDLFVSNEGETNLISFDEWDVIARYQTGGVCYINYTDDPLPGINQWTVADLYLSDNLSISEIFDPDILNPEESIHLKINLDPEITVGEKGLISISTENGVTSQCLISRN